MNIDHDDPRLTAYALGELDEAEHHELELALADDSAAQVMIHEIQRAAEVSREALQPGAQEALLDTQRQAILQTADEGARRRAEAKSGIRRWFRVALGAATAAGLLFAFLYAAQLPIGRLGSAKLVLNGTTAESPQTTAQKAEEKKIETGVVNRDGGVRPASESKKAGSGLVNVEQLAKITQSQADLQGGATSQPASASATTSNAASKIVKVPEAVHREAPDDVRQRLNAIGYLQDAGGQKQDTRKVRTGTPAATKPVTDSHGTAAIPATPAPATKLPSQSAEDLQRQRANELNELGQQNLDNKKYSRAAEYFDQGLAIAPNNASAKKGLHEAKVGQYKQEVASSAKNSDVDGEILLKDIESRKQLPAGSDAMGIKSYKMRVEVGEERETASGGTARRENDVDLYQAYILPDNDGTPATPQLKLQLGKVALRYDVDGDGVADAIPFYSYPENAREYGQNLPYSRIVGAESYPVTIESAFQSPLQAPLSTFSIDVDSASYTNVRRFLTQGNLPPKGAVRIEELLNYFDYEYAGPTGADPIAVHAEVAPCPWAPERRLARVALKAKDVPMSDRPAGNFVFVIDVSGSMDDANKLPLLKESMKLLVRKLNARDRVGIVTYRDSANVALASMPCDDKNTILAAIDSLHADGSTNGEGGIQLGYTVANANLIPGGVNRVLLATDGDFNVGVTENETLVQMIKERAKSNIFLTVLGFGSGNIKDDRLEALADKGHGHYVYVDNFNEANRVLGEQTGATLITVAKDVKVQVEFNPAKVNLYRLIGYDDRRMAAQDFNDDRKDAGEMGAGHAVTALYEIVPAGVAYSGPGLDPLKYQETQSDQYKAQESARPTSSELLTVKVRYKEPNADTSKRMDVPVNDQGQGYDQSSRDYRWAAAVAEYGMVLRDSQFKGAATLDSARAIAEGANGYDPRGQRAEFINLLVTAKTLAQK